MTPDAEPRVSVVTVFHDTRAFLAEAIESVLRQSYDDWELLLVDDGSTDGSDAIARDYSERDPRIHYLQHPDRTNLGISASRNLGLASARGEYVAQLDSDDVWEPTHLDHLVQILTSHPQVAMAYGPVQRWYSWNPGDWGTQGPPPEDFVARPLDAYDTCLEPPTLLPMMLQRPFGVPLGFVARREAVEEVGGYEDEFRGMYDDQVFLAKFALRHRVWVTSACTYRYRRHPGSIVWVSNSAGEKQRNRKRFLDWLEAYLRTGEYRDRRVWRAVRQEKWKSRHPDLTAAYRQALELMIRVRNRVRKEWWESRLARSA